MKNSLLYKAHYIIILLLFASCRSNKYNIKESQWTIKYNTESGTVSLFHQSHPILQEVYARVKIGNDTLESKNYNLVAIKKNSIQDKLGKGNKYIFEYKAKNKPQLKHCFYNYSSYPNCILTELIIENKEQIETNYITPLYSIKEQSFLPNDNSNRVVRVPFDNDNFVSYLCSPFPTPNISFEVSCFFNGKSRQGLVIGSVEHNIWKTGVLSHGNNKSFNTLEKLECYGGITHELTRDINKQEDKPSCEHGKIKGTLIKSPKILIGYHTDWRKGMEEYATINSKITPPRQWNKEVPFGWNSWGAMANHVNYTGVTDVSDFIKNDLQPKGFENNSTTYIGLDSFWDNFSDDELKEFVLHCNANNQKAGIYWCPFSDWFGNPNSEVEGTNGKYKYKDIYLYANNKPRKIESLAVDPTHPGTKQRIDYYISRFKELGFSYIKLDFINNGALEADSFYNPNVTTGIQAYNEGMDYLSKACDDLFMALSIAPIFPSQYGTSRRISCDTWGAMNEKPWGSTGYMLNSLSFGWWIDRLYPFNDADHILLYNPEEANDYKEGANRARVTSAVITGIYMLGDNFSLKGNYPGNLEARKRAIKVTTNPDINAIARLGHSFYPIEGYIIEQPHLSEKLFMCETEECTYVVIFNFDSTNNLSGKINLDRINLKKKSIINTTELWTGKKGIINNDALLYDVSPQDVQVYKINKK